MAVECPTCERVFENEMGMKTHHWQVHDKEIGKTEVCCQYCGDLFNIHDNKSDKAKFCSEECQYESYRDRISVRCSNCGDEMEIKKYRERKYEDNFCDMSCHGEWVSENNTGEENPFWKEQCFNIPYGPKYYENREKCLERYDYSCCLCDSEDDVQVHHIYPRRRAYEEFGEIPEWVNDLDNLVPLCVQHHNDYEGEFIELDSQDFVERVLEEESS
jgi:hypothetical protein